MWKIATLSTHFRQSDRTQAVFNASIPFDAQLNLAPTVLLHFRLSIAIVIQETAFFRLTLHAEKAMCFA
jgi:hypothetical protein